MKLFEFEAKKVLAENGIPVPRGRAVFTPSEAEGVAQEIKGEAVLKAQVLVVGRGKAGGIKFAEDAEEARTIAETLIGSQINGLKVRSLLVEERLGILKEIFVSITVDRFARCYAILSSTEGGG